MSLAAADALARLREGNRRFAANATAGPTLPAERRRALAEVQEPFAVILGCSDSRVPPEPIFDTGFGELFVVRVAGNVAAGSQIASVDFALSNFATKLLVVLGHSNCGAVVAALDQVLATQTSGATASSAIIDRVRPSIERMISIEAGRERDELLRKAVRANIRASIQFLLQGSQFLERQITSDGVVVAGAEYALETGVVDFFEVLP